MRVFCNSISGVDVPESDRFEAESSFTEYGPLRVGGVYEVFGLIFYGGRVDYLVSHDSLSPMWVPSCLFSIVDHGFSSGFFVSEIKKEGYEWLGDQYGARLIFGYDELVNSFEHFVGILERDKKHLDIFCREWIARSERDSSRD